MSPQIPAFKAVDGPYLDGKRQRVVKAAAGITFSIVLTENGKGMLWPSTTQPKPMRRSLLFWKW